MDSLSLNRSFKKLPAKYNAFLVPLCLSFTMSGLVSGVAILRNAGLVHGFVGLWVSTWLTSWLIAFPSVLILLPLVRRFVGLFVEAPTAR